MTFMISMWRLRRFYCTFTKISTTKTMNLEKCYFRHREKEDKIDITFIIKNNEFVRQINLTRNTSETLKTLLVRIGISVHKCFILVKKKKGSVNDVQVNLLDSQDNTLPETATCHDLFSMTKPIKLKVHYVTVKHMIMYDHVFEAVFNIPWVLSIGLQQSIIAGFPVYPGEFMMQNGNKQESILKWYCGKPKNAKGNPLRHDNINWNLVGQGPQYTPTTQDIGMKLKLECIPVKGDLSGPAVEVESKTVIEAGPGKCPFETRHMFTTDKLNGKSFRCVTYNIMADLYCDSDFTRTTLHPTCPPYALHIDYRKQLVIKELVGYNADIICLQEVDEKIFQRTLVPILEVENLNGVFHKILEVENLNRVFHKKGKQVAEGLACFYRNDRFKVLGDQSIVLAEAVQSMPCLEGIWNAVKDNKPYVDRLLDRKTISSAIYLQSLENPDEIVLVGNTHLYFHPDADHIRVTQGGIVIYWLKQVRDELVKKYPGKRISVILCGDFNSVPSDGIYQLYTTGSAPDSLPDWSSNENEAVKNLSLNQEISLGSACGTPPYTNFTADFAGCLDYIFYEISNLEVEQVVPLPSVEELRAHTALPSVVFPSDHVSLISDLRFK